MRVPKQATTTVEHPIEDKPIYRLDSVLAEGARLFRCTLQSGPVGGLPLSPFRVESGPTTPILAPVKINAKQARNFQRREVLSSARFGSTAHVYFGPLYLQKRT